MVYFFFFQAEDGIRDYKVTGVQTCALPIYSRQSAPKHLLNRMRLAHGIPAARLLVGEEMARGAAKPQGPCAPSQAGHCGLCSPTAHRHLEMEDRPSDAREFGLADGLKRPPFPLTLQ